GDPTLARVASPRSRQLDVPAQRLELRGSRNAGPHRCVRRLVVRGRQEDRRGELLPAAATLTNPELTFVPAIVRNKAVAAGVPEWIDNLPALVAELERDWSITVGATLE